MVVLQEELESLLLHRQASGAKVCEDRGADRDRDPMKTTGSLRDTSHGMTRYHIYFDDGMTVTLVENSKQQLQYHNMLSVGTDTYYLKNMRWPSGANLKKRVQLGIALVEKNLKNNRYRIKKKDK